jgi:hypothetical protein
MGQNRHEEQMYLKIKKFLEEQGYEILGRRTFQREDIGVEIGQKSVTPDVIGYKDNTVWIIECKPFCTLWFFGSALGQLAFDRWIFETKRHLLEQRIGREVKSVRYSIALQETDDHPLRSSLLETFKEILRYNGLRFGFLKVNEKTDEVKEEIPT